MNALEEENSNLERCIISLKYASPEERAGLLDAIVVDHGKVRLPRYDTTAPASEPIAIQVNENDGGTQEEEIRVASDDDADFDNSNFATIDGGGIYGPTSALHASTQLQAQSSEAEHTESRRNQLIANAALQRQNEYCLRKLPTIAGEPSELATHLLDLHWNRQHHTFLLTYRPAITRDIITGGPWSSAFLLNAIFACVSKFSERIEVRDSPLEPGTAGRRFFNRCEEMLAREALLATSSLQTVVGLLLLGGTLNARGEASKSWLYTGYALRMVYDLGLHLDRREADTSPEDVEIRRRVFWGAFIIDKLHGLYFGRPVTLRPRDARVSQDFMDTLEENELWTPYVDHNSAVCSSASSAVATPTYSVSTFKQLCLLSKISTRIINHFYAFGVTAGSARAHLQSVDDALIAWYQNLPPYLSYEPWAKAPMPSRPTSAAPNIIILLTTFNTLVILLHRPFIFDGHLRSGTTTSPGSLKKCTTAARNITSLVTSYQKAYSLRGAPYLLGYAVYNACTIHARSIAATEGGLREETSSALIVSLQYLDQLAVPNSVVSNSAEIIRRLAAANGFSNTSGRHRLWFDIVIISSMLTSLPTQM